MRATMKYKKWWHRFIPKKRKELKVMQIILDHITEKPEFYDRVIQRVTEEMIYGRAE